MQLPFFNYCMFGLTATNGCSSTFAGSAIFFIAISAIWCFCGCCCCVKKKKPIIEEKEDKQRKSKLKSPLAPAKRTNSATKKRRYSATPDKAKRQAAQARIRMPIVKQNVGNIKAKEKETVSQIKKRGVKGSKIVLSTTASSPTTDSALLTIEPDEADFKLEEKKEAND